MMAAKGLPTPKESMYPCKIDADCDSAGDASIPLGRDGRKVFIFLRFQHFPKIEAQTTVLYDFIQNLHYSYTL